MTALASPAISARSPGREMSQAFTNPIGSIQGGFLAAMLDDTLGPALVATLPTASSRHWLPW